MLFKCPAWVWMIKFRTVTIASQKNESKYETILVWDRKREKCKCCISDGISCWDYTLSMLDKWNISIEYWWNDNDMENQWFHRKTCPLATMSTTNSTWIGLGSKLGLCSVLILNITNNELKYIIWKLFGNIIVPFNVINYQSDLCTVNSISTDCLHIVVPQVLLIYCGPYKSDTLQTSLQLLFPTHIILHPQFLQKQWIEASLYARYRLKNGNKDWK